MIEEGVFSLFSSSPDRKSACKVIQWCVWPLRVWAMHTEPVLGLPERSEPASECVCGPACSQISRIPCCAPSLSVLGWAGRSSNVGVGSMWVSLLPLVAGSVVFLVVLLGCSDVTILNHSFYFSLPSHFNPMHYCGSIWLNHSLWFLCLLLFNPLLELKMHYCRSVIPIWLIAPLALWRHGGTSKWGWGCACWHLVKWF